MSWSAIIPFKGTAEHKTRLAEVLPLEARAALALRCLRHVIATLRDAGIERISILSDRRPLGWDGPMLDDAGRHLNVALAAVSAASREGPLLILHADLPLLCRADVQAMLACPERVILAPDRHGTGTNAIALPTSTVFEFAFGPGSCERHIIGAAGQASILRRLGLGFDLDTPADLAMLIDHPGQRLMPARA